MMFNIPETPKYKYDKKSRHKKWIRESLIIGLVAAVIWAIFSSFLIAIEEGSFVITIFDPALIINTVPCTIKHVQEWPQESLQDVIYFCLGQENIFFRIISNLFLVGGLTYGYIKKNRSCAIILLALPFLNYYLSVQFGELMGLADIDAIFRYFYFMVDFILSILLIFGVISTFFYRKAIKTAQS
jgi:hypothetical protein